MTAYEADSDRVSRAMVLAAHDALANPRKASKWESIRNGEERASKLAARVIRDYESIVHFLILLLIE